MNKNVTNCGKDKIRLDIAALLYFMYCYQKPFSDIVVSVDEQEIESNVTE